jgi:serine/threonine-protein kinase
MELLVGADLERIAGKFPVRPEEVVLWLRQVARALVKAHAQGIIHRDLKPENLFLTRKEDGAPFVKILDFGIAKVAGARTLTKSDQSLGTATYMAPEQADLSGRRITSLADGFALGLIAFRLLVGKSYWKEGSIAQLAAQLLTEPMPPPSARGSSLGPTFDAWFLRACHRDPGQRFPSCDQQVEALAAALRLPEQALGQPSDSRLRVQNAHEGERPAGGRADTPHASATAIPRHEGRGSPERWLAALVAACAAAFIVVALAAAVLVVAFARRKAEKNPRATDVAVVSSPQGTPMESPASPSHVAVQPGPSTSSERTNGSTGGSDAIQKR